MTGMSWEMYQDRAGEWRWRATAGNGRIVADCGEGYGSKSACREGFERFQEQAPDASMGGDTPAFKSYEDSAGEWRWRFRSRNGRTLADCGEGYSGEGHCRDAVERIQSGIAEASFEGETPATPN